MMIAPLESDEQIRQLQRQVSRWRRLAFICLAFAVLACMVTAGVFLQARAQVGELQQKLNQVLGDGQTFRLQVGEIPVRIRLLSAAQQLGEGMAQREP